MTVGIDIAKARPDAHRHPTGESARFANDAAGIAALGKWIGPSTDHVVHESTGPWRRALEESLASALPPAGVNAKRARDFARALVTPAAAWNERETMEGRRGPRCRALGCEDPGHLAVAGGERTSFSTKPNCGPSSTRGRWKSNLLSFCNDAGAVGDQGVVDVGGALVEHVLNLQDAVGQQVAAAAARFPAAVQGFADLVAVVDLKAAGGHHAQFAEVASAGLASAGLVPAATLT